MADGEDVQRGASDPPSTERTSGLRFEEDAPPAPARAPTRRVIAVKVLLAVNIAMFLVTTAMSARGSFVAGSSLRTLYDLGAMQPLAIARGHQYWRLITAMFLHAGLLHLALNMYGLYLFGQLIERLFGPTLFLAIYFVSGFMASVASYVFGNPQAVAVGASGAIFGLLGAWVAYNLRRRGTPFASANLRTAFMLILLNLVLGFSIAGVDNLAHVGGLLTGAVAGTIAEGVGPRPARTVIRLIGFALLAVAGLLLTTWRTAALA